LKNSNKKIKIHVKNNHWAAGSFPVDAEGEKVLDWAPDYIVPNRVLKNIGKKELPNEINYLRGI